MVYQYVISSNINIFYFQLNIYYTPFKTVCDIYVTKNNFDTYFYTQFCEVNKINKNIF